MIPDGFELDVDVQSFVIVYLRSATSAYFTGNVVMDHEIVEIIVSFDRPIIFEHNRSPADIMCEFIFVNIIVFISYSASSGSLIACAALVALTATGMTSFFRSVTEIAGIKSGLKPDTLA